MSMAIPMKMVPREAGDDRPGQSRLPTTLPGRSRSSKGDTAVSHEVTHDQRHLDRVAPQTRLVSADDDVATPRNDKQPAHMSRVDPRLSAPPMTAPAPGSCVTSPRP